MWRRPKDDEADNLKRHIRTKLEDNGYTHLRLGRDGYIWSETAMGKIIDVPIEEVVNAIPEGMTPDILSHAFVSHFNPSKMIRLYKELPEKKQRDTLESFTSRHKANVERRILEESLLEQQRAINPWARLEEHYSKFGKAKRRKKTKGKKSRKSGKSRKSARYTGRR